MSHSDEQVKSIQKLQHALDDPIQALGGILRNGLILLKDEVSGNNSPVNLELRIEELISKAHEKAPQISKEFIKGLLDLD